jgi:hypothetical protein
VYFAITETGPAMQNHQAGVGQENKGCYALKNFCN